MLHATPVWNVLLCMCVKWRKIPLPLNNPLRDGKVFFFNNSSYILYYFSNSFWQIFSLFIALTDAYCPGFQTMGHTLSRIGSGYTVQDRTILKYTYNKGYRASNTTSMCQRGVWVPFPVCYSEYACLQIWHNLGVPPGNRV